jgi:chorismate synthase
MNSFGRIFRVTIFGESHGPAVGVTLDGVMPGIRLSPEDFEEDMARRRGGGAGATPRVEADEPQFLSGLFNGYTTGAPLTLLFPNNNVRSADYEALRNSPRPGHADFVLHEKWRGYNDPRGGGHSSGRLTAALVAAGVVAKKMILGWVVEANLTEAGGDTDIERAIENAIAEGDSIGGIVSCTVSGLPAGLGEPFWDSVESLLAHALFAIPAIKGVEFGSGFAAATMRGSTHNDVLIDAAGTTQTNYAGGLSGGISNGNALRFRVVVKPTSSTPKVQQTWNRELNAMAPLQIAGRHDLCIALRVPVVVEAVTAMVLADLRLVRGD